MSHRAGMSRLWWNGWLQSFLSNSHHTYSIYLPSTICITTTHLDHSRECSKLYKHIFVKALYKHTWQGRLSRVMVHSQRQPNCTLCVCWHLWLTHSGNTKSRRIVRLVVLHIETLVKYILCLANKLSMHGTWVCLYVWCMSKGIRARGMCAACNM